MRKISKSKEDNELTAFANENPNGIWSEFRDTDSYKSIKHQLFDEQSFLCAYCEIDLSNLSETKLRIEHFNSKATPNLNINLDLDWENLLGVCIGGSDTKKIHPLPANLSCDSHKAHLEKIPRCWNGEVLSPLLLPSDFSLFKLEKRTGKLKPHVDNCNLIDFDENNYKSTTELVERTIDVFNLNCDRLNKARLKVFYEYERIKKRCRESNDRRILEGLVARWTRKKPLFFQTVRDQMVKEAKILLEKL